jgi:hemerythrin
MNDLLVWNDEWNTGIPDVDEMHMAMAVKLNQVFELFRECCEAAEHEHLLSNALNEFLELTREHFGDEEEKMRHCNYPDYANHKKEHIMLVAELVQYMRELEQRRVAMDSMTQSNLKNWLIAHIVIADKAFASYYHTNNTRP